MPVKTLVTIGIPIYKRLEYLPNVLTVLSKQDYPHIEILVSDNGLNGDVVPKIVEKHYRKPYRFRQNVTSVSGSEHYNQLIREAGGEYVVILADDDELSPNFVSELLKLSKRYPEASAVFGAEEVIDPDGKVLRCTSRNVPEILSGEDFIRSTFHTRKYGYKSLCTFLAKREKLLSCGGFPDIWAATSDEDLLMVKLSLGHSVAFSTRCSFRKRLYQASGGYAIHLSDLARGTKEYLACLDTDPFILKYAASHASKWEEMRGYLIESAWATYYIRWEHMYRERLTTTQWIRAGLALPFPRYLNVFVSVLARACKLAALQQVQRSSPKGYTLYRSLKTRLMNKKSSEHHL
jgi:glycosyltransferase involved in cell wall biosynthesis